jgi:hypothetical protein
MHPDHLREVLSMSARGFREECDAMLAIGSVPLPVLEQRVNQFIADGGVNPPMASTCRGGRGP